MSMKDRALRLAELGFAVFPLAAREKIPMIPKSRGGNGCLDATRDARQIASWWYHWPNANIGIATGSASGLLVVDLDGATGVAAWADLEHEHGASTTLAASTGTGGLHLYFLADDAVNSAKKIAPGIDTRGNGGYVVAPPSIHPNGTAYAWTNPKRPQPAPPWLAQMLARKPAPPNVVPIGDAAKKLGNAYATRAWEQIITRVQTAAEGTRNDQLNASSYSAGRIVGSGFLGRNEAASGLLAAALSSGLGETEARKTIESGLAAGMDIPVEMRRPASIQPPRFKTPRFYPPRSA